MNSKNIQRAMDRYAPTFLIGGIFLFFSGVLYLSLCQFSCEERQSRTGKHENIKRIITPKVPMFLNSFQPKSKTISCFLAIVIMTGPDNKERRDVIRQTWASKLEKLDEDVKIFFVIGSVDLAAEKKQKLDLENREYHDLLLLTNVQDSYYALTSKLLHTIIWLNNHVNMQFVMKADDDSFVRLDRLVDELKKLPSQSLYWGFFNGPGRVKRSGKWAEENWILCDNYLPYALGGGYILSADLIEYLAANAKYFVQFKSEDVSLGTWLAPVNVNRVHDPRFDTEYLSRGCHNSYIVTHKQSIEDMQSKFKHVKETGKLCQQENRVRNSYEYNWKIPRSKCCDRRDPNIP